jgi:hypothetical protein
MPSNGGHLADGVAIASRLAASKPVAKTGVLRRSNREDGSNQVRHNSKPQAGIKLKSNRIKPKKWQRHLLLVAASCLPSLSTHPTLNSQPALPVIASHCQPSSEKEFQPSSNSKTIEILGKFTKTTLKTRQKNLQKSRKFRATLPGWSSRFSVSFLNSQRT